MTDNTLWIMGWVDRMQDATGYCGAVLAELLACVTDEEGNDHPSDHSIEMAQQWENEPALIDEQIRASGRWCANPTEGCIRSCGKWLPIQHLIAISRDVAGKE